MNTGPENRRDLEDVAEDGAREVDKAVRGFDKSAERGANEIDRELKKGLRKIDEAAEEGADAIDDLLDRDD